MKRLITAILLFILLPLSQLPAQLAQRGLYTDHALGGGIHPTALALTSRLWYRIPLQEQRGILWDPAKLDLGARNQLSPAFEEIGAYLYWEPLALFDFTASVAARRTITAFDSGFYEVEGYDAEYEELSGSLEDEATAGFRFTFAPRLKGAYAGFVLANELKIDVFDFGSNVSNPGERFFYEPAYDTVIAFRDTVVANTLTVLYSVTPDLLLGGQYYLRHVAQADVTNHRLNGSGIYTRELRENLSFFAALLGGSYLDDRYHTGELYLAGQLGVQARLTGPGIRE
ncbi:MAG: hypothetical protein ACOC25_03970 [Alkalispirochaetaceae bacterium]